MNFDYQLRPPIYVSSGKHFKNPHTKNGWMDGSIIIPQERES